MATNINSEARLSSAADCGQRKHCSSRMTSGQMDAPIQVFLGKQRCNVAFAVDSSEEMRAVLGSAKRLLIQTLLTKASLRDSLFNIIAFSGKLTCWSHHMLPCAPDTVYMSLSWIHSISCSPGRDLLAALSLALADPSCQAVHVLCKDLPDHPEAVLSALPALAAGRPVNTFYLLDSGGQLDGLTRDYLQHLTLATGGSCYVIPVGLNGVLEKVIPLCVADSQSLAPSLSSVKCCHASSLASLPHNTSSSLLRCSVGSPVCMLPGQTWSPEFIPGCRVLARREVDGFYYLGTVVQQVQGHRGVWVVDFDHPVGASLGVVSSQRQLVCSLDMVNQTRAHARCLVPGDAVLSPWEPDLRRYGPGRVIAATERRDCCGADGVGSVRVLMWNHIASLAPGSLVFPVSHSQHDRIVRELRLPSSASSRCCSWLCARSSSCTPQLFCRDRCQSPSYCCSVADQRPCMFPPSYGEMDGLQRADEEAEVTRSDPVSHSFSSSSSSSLSLCEDETGATSPPAARLRSKGQRPPWRYWRRTGPEPQHRQPGSAVQRRTSQPTRFIFPVPQTSASPNHSSLFQSLPGVKGRRVNIRDVFGTSTFKPRPPEGLQPFSGNSAAALHT